MTTIMEKQAPHQQTTEQEHGTEQEDGKIELDGKSFSFDDDNDGANADTTETPSKMKTTNDTTITTITVQYDVEHLATFSTASSHEQQVGAATPTTTANHNESSKFKLKQAPTNDSSNITEPREALQKLFELEKLSGIWTQRMQIELQQDFMLIIDCETNSIVERFHKDRVTKPEAFNHYNDIYNNIVVFNIDQQQQQAEKTTQNSNQRREDCDKTSGELHIFQCVSHRAKQIVSDISAWKSSSKQVSELVGVLNETENKSTMPSSGPTAKATGVGVAPGFVPDTKKEAIKMSSKDGSQETRKEVARKPSNEGETTTTNTTTTTPPTDSNNLKPVVTVASSSKSSETVPIVNVNVKETVQVFNQIAALREKSSGVGQTARPLSDASSSSQSGSASSSQQQQASSSTTSSEFSRAPLGPAGQSYKQRSIRATLAPKAPLNQKEEPSKLHNQDLPTSSSSSTAAADQTTNGGGGGGAKFAANSLAASSSRPDHRHHLDATMDQTATSGQVPASSTSSSSSAEPTTNNNHDGNLQQASSQKHAASHNNNNNSHTRSSSSGHHHNHNHNHQHQHDQQQKQPLVKAKGSGNKHGSASSRLPATNGHHHQNHNHHNHHGGHQGGALAVQSSNSSGRSHGSPPLQQQAEQVTSNESYVSVLNHCFDDIEKFILRIQHAYAAKRELQAKKRHTKRSAAAVSQSNKSHPNGPLPPLPAQLSASELAMLVAQAQGPNADDYFEILSKFKLAFNLLAKLKGCIHEPNAPELVHFLFTPLAIIIESARNLTPPVDPTVVGIPYLNKDALDLLSNCCTSKESDLWLSLGPNWTETIDAQLLRAARLPNSFQPIFSDGWAPVISELELIGLVMPPVSPAEGGDSSHYCSSGGGQLMMDEPVKGSRLVNHDETIRNGPPPPLPPLSTTNGIPLSASNNNNNSSRAFKAKRTSPTGAINSRYADPALQTGYLQSDPGYLREQPDMLDGPLAVADVIHPAGPYRVPELQMGHHHHQHQQHHRSARNSMPTSEKSSRSGAKHPAHGARTKRNSEYIGHGQYAPSSVLNASFIGPKDGLVDGRYHGGYPSTNPSNDYTELQISSLQNGHYMAGPSARHGEEPFSHGSSQHTSSDHSRRKGSKSSYSRPYLAEPQYDDDHGHALMVHEVEREAMLIDMGPAQTEWFYELKLRGALIVRVLFTRDANNDKELTVKRGEILEILDDTRKWWKARNIDLQVAYVPHTIVAVMEHYQTLDELLTGSSSDMMMMMMNEDQGGANVDSQRYAHREPQGGESFQNQYYGLREERRNSKTAKGAFRYF